MPIVVTGPIPQVPATDSTSMDGIIRARVLEDYAGIHLTVDYTSLLSDPGFDWPNPFRATIFRVDESGNTVIVRSADARHQGGGKFYAFDDEVSFGHIYTYYAEAYDADGEMLRRGYGAAVQAWSPSGGDSIPGVWIKSLDYPDRSGPVRVRNWGQWNFGSRNSSADLLDSRYSAINMRPRDAGSSALQVLTKNQAEYEAFQSVAEYGIVFIASLNRAWQRDGYYVFGDISPDRPTEFQSDYDYWTVGLTVVERPKTANQNSPIAPWGSFADAKRLYPTYAAAKLHYPTYADQTLDGTL